MSSTVIGELYLSNNGQYLINNEKIYFALENKSYSLNEISLSKWIDILSENTAFSLKHNLVEVKELASYHRKITYQIFESLSFDAKSMLMLEYEMKFGNILLTESVNLSESFFSDSWNWVKEKSKKFGAAGKTVLQNIGNCIAGRGCSPLFESFREALYSPVGIGLNVFLSITGIGKLGLIVVWGMMLLWDIYLLSTGSPEFTWLNLIFDVLGIGMGSYAVSSRSALGGAKAVLQTRGKSLPEVVAYGMKNPQMSKVFKEFGKISTGGGMNKIMNSVKNAGDFLSKKMGMRWASTVSNKVSGQVAKVSNAIGIETKRMTQTVTNPKLAPAPVTKTPTQAPVSNLEVREAASLTSPSTTNNTTTSDTSSSPSVGTSSGGAGDGFPSSPSAEDMPAYPEVGHWESGVTRGVANPVGTVKKREDYPESEPKRGKANPLR